MVRQCGDSLANTAQVMKAVTQACRALTQTWLEETDPEGFLGRSVWDCALIDE